MEDFRDGIQFCLEAHSKLKQLEGALEVGYNFRKASVGFGKTVQDALGILTMEQRMLLLRWIDKHGPFWDRPQKHSSGEYFEYEGALVTDTVLAEVAHLVAEGECPVLVSLPDSKFQIPSLEIHWHEGPKGSIIADVENVFSLERLELIAKSLEPDFENYRDLVVWAQRNCPRLALVRNDILVQLGTTFIPAVARAGKQLFHALNAIAEALASGNDARYLELCNKWLKSERFSDASTSEKNAPDFRRCMTFRHPCTNRSLECFWHGKV